MQQLQSLTPMKTKLVSFDSLAVGAVFFAPGNQLVSFRKTARGVTFGCYRRGEYTYRRSALYGPNSFRGSQVEVADE